MNKDTIAGCRGRKKWRLEKVWTITYIEGIMSLEGLNYFWMKTSPQSQNYDIKHLREVTHTQTDRNICRHLQYAKHTDINGASSVSDLTKTEGMQDD